MTILSGVGHAIAMIALLLVTWFQPIPKLKRPIQKKVNVKFFVRTPIPVTPRKTARVVRTTPKPKTPPPKKTVVKKTPTPKKKTPRKKTPTPRKTRKRITPRKTQKPRPTATPKRIPKVTATPKQTPRPALTPDPGEKVTMAKSPLSDFEYYWVFAQRKFKSNFTAPRHIKAKGVTCLIQFTVLRDGRITQIKLVRSTGDPLLDRYALRAVEVTATLQPFPDTEKADHAVQQVMFDYSPEQ